MIRNVHIVATFVVSSTERKRNSQQINCSCLPTATFNIY